MRIRGILAAGGGLLVVAAVAAWAGGLFTMSQQEQMGFPQPDLSTPEEAGPLPGGLQQATFGSGCFWCSEAVFQRLKGVHSVVSGYSGGEVEGPSYQDVCTGMTGHAEVVQVTYDPKVVTYPELLEVFWRTHDPTTPNRQGNDVGTQYRSVIFYHNDRQQRLAEHYKDRIDAAHVFDEPLVTQIVPFRTFYPAEDYHQNYFNENPRQPYCAFVIGPKVEKLKKLFHDKLKP